MKPINVLAKFLEVRDVTHALHLNTTSYAEHKALGAFYDGWLDLVDKFMETYQGSHGRVAGEFTINVSSGLNSSEYLSQVRAFIQLDAPSIIAPDLDKDLDNILAEMLGLVNHTLYLLTLK
jgi:hypothetical protein